MVQVQVHTCVIIQCAQCDQPLGSPEFEAHYPSEDAAVAAAEAAGWVDGPGGCWWCSACGPVLECQAQGHEFTDWRPLIACRDEVDELVTGVGSTTASDRKSS